MKKWLLYMTLISVITLLYTPKAKAITASNYPTILITTYQTNIYDPSGKVMQTVKKGTKVELVNITNTQGIVKVGQTTGYTDLKNYRHIDVVDGSKSMSYAHYTYILKAFALMYPESVKLQKIGQSVDGRALYAFQLGKGKKEIYIDAATHAREHMTTNVVMEMIDTYTKSYVRGTTLYGYDVKKVLDRTSIWFVPMVNPDGVMLVQQGLKSVSKPYQAAVLAANNGSTNFARYKANIRGVDINRNYNVDWQQYRSPSKPSYQFYKGKTPVSEPETAALVKFVKQHQFKTYLAYHSSGQVLYWRYKQTAKQEAIDRKVMNLVRQATGYTPIYDSGIANGSGAGQDWFVAKMKQPGITVEIAPAVGQKPVPHAYWPSVWQKNKAVGLLTANEAATR